MRIAGVIIPSKKRLRYALCSIYGIGSAKALVICERAGLSPEVFVDSLTDGEQVKLREVIDAASESEEIPVEGKLRTIISVNIKRLKDLGSYRGLRHRRGLPVRGQRTHTNARTRKGPAKPIAGKKK